eukprot:NODE_2494_length_1162_cov_21.846377_g2377_i0.p1 GENE.NODE_2494_length_1162_cov_21.846377_g2377_i0~~NODE_2494_length_1162_cov_21.846377_g2377_i0.p1  ORF type:complete len:372 (+),score=133.70 NODE_2494_length_1162_cov_21.846377_g2377_i0:61-1116(+)
MAATGVAASKKGEKDAFVMGDEGFEALDEGQVEDSKKKKLKHICMVTVSSDTTASEVKDFFQPLPILALKFIDDSTCKVAFGSREDATKASGKAGVLRGKPVTIKLKLKSKKPQPTVSSNVATHTSKAVEANIFDELQKQKKLANRIAQQVQEEALEELATQEALRLQMKRYKRSSEFKRKCWQEKAKSCGKWRVEAEWAPILAAHNEKAAEFRAQKELFDRQARIDKSWEPIKQAPKPKPKGKRDPRMYAGMVATPAVQPAEQTERELPWDPEQHKDPNRPAATKKAEKQQFEKLLKAWNRHNEEFSKLRVEHDKEIKRLQDLGMDTEPDFQTDPSSGHSESDSDSDSDF